MSDTLSPTLLPPSSDQAIGTLYVAHHGWLLSFLRRRLGSQDSAADLAHDTFERLMHGYPSHAMQQPRAYLTTIAKNLLASHFRRAMVERAYLEVLASQVEAAEPSVESRALILEALDALCKLVDGMDARTRSIFLLAQMDGMRYPDIATHLNISLDVVKKSMSKALQRCYLVVYG